jgi:hypothetical protein
MSNKNCNHKVPCGCADSSLTTPPPCNDTGNCAGEVCAESIGQKCVVYDNNSLLYAISGNDFEIKQGERLDEVIQRLLIFLNDPTCAESAPVGLFASLVTVDSITLQWTGSDPAYTYSIDYTDGIAALNTTSTTTSVSLTGLVPDTEYSITVTTVDTSCASVTIKVKTKSL